MTNRPRQRRRPQRTCVACREVRDKAKLLRIVLTPDGVHLDPEQRTPGRGAYVCAGADCVEAAGRRGGQPLQRALRGAGADQVRFALDELRAHLPPAPRQHHTPNLPGTLDGADDAVAGAVAEEKTDALRGEQERTA